LARRGPIHARTSAPTVYAPHTCARTSVLNSSSPAATTKHTAAQKRRYHVRLSIGTPHFSLSSASAHAPRVRAGAPERRGAERHEDRVREVEARVEPRELRGGRIRHVPRREERERPAVDRHVCARQLPNLGWYGGHAPCVAAHSTSAENVAVIMPSFSAGCPPNVNTPPSRLGGGATHHREARLDVHAEVQQQSADGRLEGHDPALAAAEPRADARVDERRPRELGRVRVRGEGERAQLRVRQVRAQQERDRACAALSPVDTYIGERLYRR
jgi:hypothetical protein